MNSTEIIRTLKDEAPLDYSFNQYVTFGFPFKKMSAVVRVQHHPDDDLKKIHHIIIRAVKHGYKNENELLAFLGSTENDNFLCREIALLINTDLLEKTDSGLCITKLGKEYLEGTDSPLVEDTLKYDFVENAISSEINSCEALYDATQKRPAKYIDPQDDSFIRKHFNHSHDQEITEAFQKDFAGNAMLLEVLGHSPKSFLFWNQYILVEYTADDIDDWLLPPYYQVRLTNDLTIHQELTRKFNEEYSKYIPSLLM